MKAFIQEFPMIEKERNETEKLIYEIEDTKQQAVMMIEKERNETEKLIYEIEDTKQQAVIMQLV